MTTFWLPNFGKIPSGRQTFKGLDLSFQKKKKTASDIPIEFSSFEMLTCNDSQSRVHISFRNQPYPATLVNIVLLVYYKEKKKKEKKKPY